MRKRRSLTVAIAAAAFLIASRTHVAWSGPPSPLEPLFSAHELVVLADVKHGVGARISFFSSEALFEAMARGGVRHVAIEMPRVLGRQALGVDTEADVAAFAQDVVNSGRWHFVDPDHPDAEEEATQRSVASAMARQVLLAKQYGLTPIFYDFNNPLGGFTSAPNDPVYRCLAALSATTWVKYGLDQKISKADRDAAIMRERFSHDDELADYIERDVLAHGGGKVVVIPGFAHAVLPRGLTERLEERFGVRAAIVAVFRDAVEEQAFPSFLKEQAQLLKVDLSRPYTHAFRIAEATLDARGVEKNQDLDGSKGRIIPSVCFQFAKVD